MDDETIYHWASITKTLTGIAIMQLRDRGRLSLDDPAVKYVPELREIHNPYGDVSQVTIRHLMTHSSGLRAGTWPWGGDKPWHPFEPTRWAQFVAMLPYTDLRFQPGTKYSYSNPGVIILGRIIELLSGDDYEVYIAKNIFMPLGMTRSFFDRAPYHLVAASIAQLRRHRRRHHRAAVRLRYRHHRVQRRAERAARRHGQVPGVPEHGNGTVLQRSSLDEMFTPQIRAGDGEGGSGDDVQAGLSSFIERHGGVELVGHSGDQNGFISHLYVHRPSRSGYIVVVQHQRHLGARPAPHDASRRRRRARCDRSRVLDRGQRDDAGRSSRGSAGRCPARPKT